MLAGAPSLLHNASMPDPDPKPSRHGALLERLYAEFPVFRDHQPLAIGIHKALTERFPDLDRGQVRTAMHFHTGTTRYLKAIVEGAPRLDLDGNATTVVTAEQQAQAVATLRERFRKGAERRRAELEARQRQEKLEQLAQKFKPG
jgi:ProP effector